MMKDVGQFLDRKALLNYEGFSSESRVDYSFLEAMYGSDPYMCDPNTETLG